MEWFTYPSLIEYPDAMREMESHVDAMIAGRAKERIWLLEHPPLYTAGTSAQASDLIDSERFPVYATGRGGQYTYHGPGQRIAYVMLNLHERMSGKPDIRHFVWLLEEWIILTLQKLGITAERREGRVGLWVMRPDESGEDKIAAIGIRIRRWVSFHGIALNIDPDLSHFSGIVPCGIRQHGVTSLAQHGIRLSMAECDALLKTTFKELKWQK